MSFPYFTPALRKVSDYDHAMADWSRAIELNPANPHYYRSRGELYRKIGNDELAMIDHANAVEVLTRAIELDPNDPVHFRDRGHNYHEIGEYDLALADFTHAIGIDTQNGWQYFARSLTYHKLGNRIAEYQDLEKSAALKYGEAIKKLAEWK